MAAFGCTCQEQLDNPVYDGSAGIQSQTSYSSSGPTYELVEVKEEIGYNVIDWRRDPRLQPFTIPPESHDPSSNQDYSTLESAVEGSNYHVIELRNMGGDRQV